MKKIIKSPKLEELKRQMSEKFDMSFGHNLTDDEREANYQEYLKLRAEYIAECQNLGKEVIYTPIFVAKEIE